MLIVGPKDSNGLYPVFSSSSDHVQEWFTTKKDAEKYAYGIAAAAKAARTAYNQFHSPGWQGKR